MCVCLWFWWVRWHKMLSHILFGSWGRMGSLVVENRLRWWWEMDWCLLQNWQWVRAPEWHIVQHLDDDMMLNINMMKNEVRWALCRIAGHQSYSYLKGNWRWRHWSSSHRLRLRRVRAAQPCSDLGSRWRCPFSVASKIWLSKALQPSWCNAGDVLLWVAAWTGDLHTSLPSSEQADQRPSSSHRTPSNTQDTNPCQVLYCWTTWKSHPSTCTAEGRGEVWWEQIPLQIHQESP